MNIRINHLLKKQRKCPGHMNTPRPCPKISSVICLSNICKRSNPSSLPPPLLNLCYVFYNDNKVRASRDCLLFHTKHKTKLRLKNVPKVWPDQGETTVRLCYTLSDTLIQKQNTFLQHYMKF